MIAPRLKPGEYEDMGNLKCVSYLLNISSNGERVKTASLSSEREIPIDKVKEWVAEKLAYYGGTVESLTVETTYTETLNLEA